MRKFHLTFAFVALTAVMLGSYFVPDTPALWLTSNDNLTQIVRLVLVGIVGAQLITTPPRPFAFRTVTMVSALFAIGLGLYALGGPNSPIVDTFLFLQTGVALAITALEAKEHVYHGREDDLVRT